MLSVRREPTPFKVWAINIQQSVGNVLQVPERCRRTTDEVRCVEITTEALSTCIKITVNVSRNV